MLAIVGAIVVVLLSVTGGGGKRSVSAPGVRTTNAPAPRGRSGTAALNPASITVAVLNGTATGGLAHRVASRLASGGYKQGLVGNTADQTRTATTIAYLRGRMREALAVASTLKLGPASVHPVDPGTQALACPPPTPCTANVVVTVGSDLATR